jgi:hypothetical protein
VVRTIDIVLTQIAKTKKGKKEEEDQEEVDQVQCLQEFPLTRDFNGAFYYNASYQRYVLDAGLTWHFGESLPVEKVQLVQKSAAYVRYSGNVFIRELPESRILRGIVNPR